MAVCVVFQLLSKVEQAVSSLHVILDHTHYPVLLSLPQLVSVIIDSLRSPLLENILQEVWVKVTVATLRKGAKETGRLGLLPIPLAPSALRQCIPVCRSSVGVADTTASVSKVNQEAELGGGSCDHSTGDAAEPLGAGSSHTPPLVLPRPPTAATCTPAWQRVLENGRYFDQSSVDYPQCKPVFEVVHCCELLWCAVCVWGGWREVWGGGGRYGGDGGRCGGGGGRYGGDGGRCGGMEGGVGEMEGGVGGMEGGVYMHVCVFALL